MPSSVRSGVGAAVVVALVAALTPIHPAAAWHEFPSASMSADESADPETQSPVAARGVGNVAHRGASRRAPENTMAAVRQAIAHRADFVGIDVHRTRDGRLVVLHDAKLARTTDVEEVFPGRRPWLVEDFTMAEIRRLDAGSWLSPIYSGEHVPTLRRVLKELAPSTTGAFLEIKQPRRYGGVQGIGAQVMDEIAALTSWLEEGGPARRLVVQAFNDGFVKAFVQAYPEVAVGTLGPTSDRMGEYSRWGVDQVNVHHRDVDPDLVAEADSLGLEVSTYVVNDVDTMRAVLDAGVDAVSTDYPGDLHALLKKRGQLFAGGPAPQPTQPADVDWSLTVPATALLAARIPVDARLMTVAGERARWAWVRVEHRTSSGWRSLQRRRVTDRKGELNTTVEARDGLRIRMRSVASPWYAERLSAVQRVDTRRASTRVTLSGARRVSTGASARLPIRWRAEDGRAVTGDAVLRARPSGRNWRRIRSIRVVDGDDSVRVRPRRDTRYQLRARRGSWYRGDRNRHYINVTR